MPRRCKAGRQYKTIVSVLIPEKKQPVAVRRAVELFVQGKEGRQGRKDRGGLIIFLKS